MRAFLLTSTAALALVAAAGALGGCGGQQFTADVSRTSTVTLGNASLLTVSAPVVVDVVSSAVGRDVIVKLTAVVTASTSAVAEAVAASITLEATSPDDRTRHIAIDSEGEGRIEGVLLLTVPENMELAVSATGLRTRGMKRLVEARTSMGVEVYDAAGTVRIETGGGAIVDTLMLQSTEVIVQATGAVDLRLPAVPSVSLVAVSGGQSGVTVAHPALPTLPGKRSEYQAVVNGGLARAQLQSTAGGVTIQQRQR